MVGREFVVGMLKSSIPGWQEFEAARTKLVRVELDRLLREGRPELLDTVRERMVSDALPKLLEASLPLHEFGGEALIKLGGLLKGSSSK
jgi:hypothetical protein